MSRDFVFIDDLIEAITRLFGAVPKEAARVEDDSLSPVPPWRLVKIGKSDTDLLAGFIAAIEAACGRNAMKEFLPVQPGDMPATWADATLLAQLTDKWPASPLSTGIPQFVDWYCGWNAKDDPQGGFFADKAIQRRGS